NDKPKISEMRSFLKERLPEYMIPAYFVRMERLPLNANKKVDVKALPAPGKEQLELGEEYVAPRSEQEKQLAEIWAEVLGIERVGVRDNFFDLGGDSIRSILVVSMGQQRGLSFLVQDVFYYPTIEELVREIEIGEGNNSAAIEYEAFSLISEDDRRQLPEG